MPRIKEYTPQVEASGAIGGRAATAEDFGSAVDQGLGTFGAGVEKLGEVIQKNEEQVDVSNAHAKLSQLFANKTIELKEKLRTAKPGEIGTLAQDFNEKLKDEMSQMGGDLATNKGKLFFNRQSAEVQRHLFTSAVAGQVELRGKQAAANYDTALGNYETAIYNDPNAAGPAKVMLDSLLQDYVAGGGDAKNIPELRAKGLENLTAKEVQARALVNPTYTHQLLSSGTWDKDLSGETKAKLVDFTEQSLRAQQNYQKYQQKAKDDADKEAISATQNDFLQKAIDGKLTNETIMKSNLEVFGSGSKDTFINLLASKKLETDSSVFNSLLDRIRLPDGDPKKLIDDEELWARLNNGVSEKDVKNLIAIKEQRGTDKGKIEARMMSEVENLGNSLTKSNSLTGQQDPDGDKSKKQWHDFVRDAYEAERSKGVSQFDLLNSRGSKYLGSYIDQFKKSPEEVLKSMLGSEKYGPQEPLPSTEKKKIPAAPPGRVNVQAPDGAYYTVPENQVNQLPRGYIRVR